MGVCHCRPALTSDAQLHERARELAAGLVAILDAKNRETSDAIDRILKVPHHVLSCWPSW